jgi:MFS family permease
MSLRRNIRLLTWFNFFTDFKLYGLIAIIYFSKVTHSFALGGLIFSITYITSSLFDIPTGLFSDRIGRKKTVVLGAITAVLYAIFYAIGINFWILAIGAFLEGLSRAFYSGNNNALLHNMLSEEGLENQYHSYSGKLSAMFQASAAISGIVGGIIATFSFAIVMWLSVIPQLFCVLISSFLTESRKKDVALKPSNGIVLDLKEAIVSFKNNSNLRLLSISNIISYGLNESSYQFQAAFYNTLLPIWAVSIAKSLSSIFAGISFYFSGPIINKLGYIKTLLIDDIYGNAVYFIALLIQTKFSPFLISSTSLLYGAGTTANSTLMQKEFTEKQRATMSSLNSFASSLFFGVSTFVLGLFADKIGPSKSILIIQVLLLSVIWFHWKLYKLVKNKEKS